MHKNFLSTNPVLPVQSINDTAHFYQQALGFSIEILWENPPYAVVKRDDAVIEFGEGRKEHAGTGVCIIRADNADAIYEEWKARGIDFVGDFAERDYGSKDFRIRDNNGNILIVGHALENQQALLDKGNVA